MIQRAASARISSRDESPPSCILVPARSRVRRGVVLPAMLWLIVACSAVALTAQLQSREAVTASSNRMALVRGRWLAEGCIALVRSVVSQALAAVPPGTEAAVWQRLDQLIAEAPTMTRMPSCHVEARPRGDGIDVNSLDDDALLRLFSAVDIAPTLAASLADAVLDWRDDDALARPSGAEREWYVSRRRVPPRDGPLWHVNELQLIKGFDSLDSATWARLTAALEFESTPLVLSHAAPAALAALPGFSVEAVRRLLELRAMRDSQHRWDDPLTLVDLSAVLSPEARAVLTPHVADVNQRVVSVPQEWTLIARIAPTDRLGHVLPTGLEVLLSRVGHDVVITRALPL